MNRSRNGNFKDSLHSVDTIEIVKVGGVVLEVCEKFFCYNLQFNSYVKFVNNMVAKRDLHEKQGKDLLQGLYKKVSNSVYGGNICVDNNDQFKCVTEVLMKGK